ncbi:MAG: hypothetical protein HPY69_02565 [Armatimonadetes bacterium]|nr:hypothetical protein [Armatimonadota bacterium]
MIHAHTNFPGGSVRDLRVEGGVIRFAAVRHESVYSMWWQFALNGPGGPVRCIWESTDEVLGSDGLDLVVPVYTTAGGSWRRVDPRTCYHNPRVREFGFMVPTAAGETRVAYCYPYDWDRVEAFIADVAQQPGVTVREVGKSEGGRPFRVLKLGQGERHLWLTARHHAGETPGAYVLEGAVRELLQHPRWLASMTMHAAPAMDVDGVAEGWYGKEREPRDFNRDYCARPCRPEVRALMAYAEGIGKADLILDLHAPAPPDFSFLVPVKESSLSLQEWVATWEFGRMLDALAPRSCPVRVMDAQPGAMNWSGETMGQTSTGWFHRRFGAIAATLETTYHHSHDGRLVTPRGWLALGKAVAHAAAAQSGLRSRPDVADIELPRSRVPRFAHWQCVHWPQGVTLHEEGQWLEARSPNPDGYAWVFSPRVLAAEAARFRYEYAGPGGALAVHARGYDPDRDLSTGDTSLTTLELRPTRRPRTVTVASPDPWCQLFFRMKHLRGTLRLAVG